MEPLAFGDHPLVSSCETVLMRVCLAYNLLKLATLTHFGGNPIVASGHEMDLVVWQLEILPCSMGNDS